MERFYKRKVPPASDVDGSGSIRNARRDNDAPNVNNSTRPLLLSRKEVNLDELSYDPSKRKRISQYISPKLQDEIRRKYLLRGPYRPPPGFKYPQKIIAGTPRRFSSKWFTMYSWLEYSDKVDKCFCLYCYMLRDSIEGQGGNDAFTVDGWSAWNKSNRLKDHAGGCNSFHNTLVKRCNNLLNVDPSIGTGFKKQSDADKEKHKIRFNNSITAIRYLLHQGLPFQGHDESEKSTNKRNFLELIKVLATQNEAIKKVVLENAPRTNKMVAPAIQKDITNCFAQIIVKSIIEEIGGDVFCLLVDESANVSDKEQMAMVLRYVDKLGAIKERLIGIVHVKETSVTCLKSNIDYLFKKYGLTLKQVRGQGYDGASNMRGEFNGLRALILRENSSAYYVHCFAHQLQLVIMAVAKKNDDISNFFDMVSLLLNVAGASCKRKDMIREGKQERVTKSISNGQLSSGSGLNQEQSLQRASDTRWCSHYKTLKSVNNLFPDIIDVLQYIEKDGPNDGKNVKHVVFWIISRILTSCFICI